jgi:hypothetical protein
VKLAGSIAMRRPLATDTSTAPLACGPVTAVIEPLEFTTTFEAGLPPTATVAVGEKLLPVILIGVPPSVLPAAGVTPDTASGPSVDWTGDPPHDAAMSATAAVRASCLEFMP